MDITVGCDPEFFLKKGNKHVSAHDIVPGNKRNPFSLSRGAVQADGTAVEFNIVPAISADAFASNIADTIAEVRALVPRELEFDFSPSIVYPRKYFDELPQQSKDLGCDPDFNAYTSLHNNPPTPPPGLETMRTGSGHIHIGWTDNKDPKDRSHFWDCCTLTKALDHYFERAKNLWDNDHRRQSLYGAKGAFRPKPYGCEYRVLSNAWLKYPKLWPWLFESVKFVVDRTVEHKPPGYSYGYSLNTVDDHNQWLRETFGNKVPLIPEDFKP